MTDNKPTHKELVDALELMALQYLSDDSGYLDHEFMSAGEHCMDCLERLGLVKDDKFTEQSNYYVIETVQNEKTGKNRFLKYVDENGRTHICDALTDPRGMFDNDKAD